MNYPQFAARAWPVTALALLAAAVALGRHSSRPAATPPAATPAPVATAAAPAPQVVTVTQVVFRPVDLATPRPREQAPGAAVQPPEARATATPAWVSPGPVSTNPVSADENRRWLAQFDQAMDREFARLEDRERSSTDSNDLAMVTRLKGRLSALDDVWSRADQATDVDERIRLQGDAQRVMTEIIQLSRADRNQRLRRVASQFGLEQPADVGRFIDEVDRAFVETHLDWATLFNRGVVLQSSPSSPGAGTPPVSPGPGP